MTTKHNEIAERVLNQIEPNGELLNTEQCIKSMEAYSNIVNATLIRKVEQLQSEATVNLKTIEDLFKENELLTAKLEEATVECQALKEKEIKGDRKIVELEHCKTVLSAKLEAMEKEFQSIAQVVKDEYGEAGMTNTGNKIYNKILALTKVN